MILLCRENRPSLGKCVLHGTYHTICTYLLWRPGPIIDGKPPGKYYMLSAHDDRKRTLQADFRSVAG